MLRSSGALNRISHAARLISTAIPASTRGRRSVVNPVSLRSPSGCFRQSEFGRIILPFTVLRRLECVLEPTREAVRNQARMLKGSSAGELVAAPERRMQRFWRWKPGIWMAGLYECTVVMVAQRALDCTGSFQWRTVMRPLNPPYLP